MIGLEARDARKWKAAEDVLKNYETDVMGRQEAERKCVEHAKHAEDATSELNRVSGGLDEAKRECEALEAQVEELKQELEACRLKSADEVEAAWKDVFSKPHTHSIFMLSLWFPHAMRVLLVSGVVLRLFASTILQQSADEQVGGHRWP